MPLTVDLPNFVALVRRRKTTFIVVFLLTFVIAAGVSLLLPNKYSSSMSFLIRSSPSDLTDTPDRASTPRTTEVSEADVNSEVELLTGYDILKTAVIQNGLAKRSLFSPSGSQSPEAVDSAVRKLAKDLQVTPIRKANIVEVTYVAKTPALAASVLRSISAAYLETHLRAQSTPGGYQFFQAESDYYRQVLQKNEQALADLRQREGVGNINDQRTLLTQMLLDRQAGLQASQATVAELQEEVKQARTTLGGLRSRHETATKTGINQFTVDHLTSLLVDLQNRRSQLASKFLDNDPIVREVDREIAQTQASLAQSRQSSALETEQDVNPAYQTLEISRNAKLVDLRGAQIRERVLQQQVNENQKALDHLSAITGQYEVANAAVQRAQEDYSNYLKRREEARVAEQLDRNKITNVVTAQAPTESQLPVPSHTLVNLALSLILAFSASVVAALLSEYRAQRASVPPQQVILA